MAVFAHHHGSDWNQELYDQTFEKVVPDRSSPPAGMIAHFAAPLEGGGWQVWEAWESKEAFEQFARATLMPAVQELGAPPFDSDFTEIHNQLLA